MRNIPLFAHENLYFSHIDFGMHCRMPEKLKLERTSSLRTAPDRQSVSLPLQPLSHFVRWNRMPGRPAGAIRPPSLTSQNGVHSSATDHRVIQQKHDQKFTVSILKKYQTYLSNASQTDPSEDLTVADNFRLSSDRQIFKNPMITGILGTSYAQMLFSSFVHFLAFLSENLREFCNELLRSFSSPQMRTQELAHLKIFLSEVLRNVSSDQSIRVLYELLCPVSQQPLRRRNGRLRPFIHRSRSFLSRSFHCFHWRKRPVNR